MIDLESGQEKTLATVAEPLIFEGPPTLSPDGRRFVTGIHTAEKGIHGQLASIDATTLAQTRFGPTGWEAGSFAWFPDGMTIYFLYGNESNDIVLLNNFR